MQAGLLTAPRVEVESFFVQFSRGRRTKTNIRNTMGGVGKRERLGGGGRWGFVPKRSKQEQGGGNEPRKTSVRTVNVVLEDSGKTTPFKSAKEVGGKTAVTKGNKDKTLQEKKTCKAERKSNRRQRKRKTAV